MSSKIYTNIVLTLIAVFLGANLFKGSFDLPFETTAQAQFKTGNTGTFCAGTGYNEYKLFFMSAGFGDNTPPELLKQIRDGWKPITISQSEQKDYPNASVTVLLGR